MDKGDLALDEAAHEHLVAVADGSGYRKDLVTLRMRPPAALNRPPDDEGSQRRDRPFSGLEYDAVLTNERESLA